MTLSSLLSLFLLTTYNDSVEAEHRRFDGPIEAASNYIHYSEGFVVTPGYVDISELEFEAASESLSSKLFSEGVVEAEEFVDIVLFHEPSDCANARYGCDWTQLGIGASDNTGNLRWCCSDDAAALGLCSGSPKQEGRLIIDPDKFMGQHKFLMVPSSGEWKRKVKDGLFKLDNKAGTSGKYVFVMANCNNIIGRNLTVSGQYTWSSVHGYLPGNLLGQMYFFFLVFACYVLLFAFYACKMRKYRDAIIPIQKWVLAAIGIGVLELFFKGGDLWVWNVDGDRFWFSLYTGLVMGVLKRAISRYVVVMLCLGWGVACNASGSKFKVVVMLRVLNIGTSAVRDVMAVVAITENEILSVNEETEILDIVTILTFCMAAIDAIFYLWIFDALNGTMQYLESKKQALGVTWHMRLRLIIFISVFFTIMWTVFVIVDSYYDRRVVLKEENGWVLSSVWEINYVILLLGLCCLWVPEPGAKEYAYTLELSALGGDLKFDTAIVDCPGKDHANPENVIANRAFYT
eukprot:CCRYP_008523-RA/>CCRYP_008523-RA protein AED:0.11 eAED:0.11 QI:0/0.5/0.33/1/0.5/0.33/3/128/516